MIVCSWHITYCNVFNPLSASVDRFCLDELQCQLMAARIHSDDVGNTRRIGIHPSSYFRLHSLDAAENIWGFDEVLIGDANRSLSAADVLYHISQLDAPLSCIIVEIPQVSN